MWDIGRVMAIWLAAGGVSSGTTSTALPAPMLFALLQLQMGQKVRRSSWLVWEICSTGDFCTTQAVSSSWCTMGPDRIDSLK